MRPRSRKVGDNPALKLVTSNEDPPNFYIKKVDEVTGYGVFSTKLIEKGDALFLYKGTKVKGSTEVLDDEYVFEFSHKGTLYCIDAAKDDGSIGRMVNDEHRSPNSVPKVIEVNGDPHIVFFALKAIKPHEEIRYNYGIGYYPWRKKVEKLAVSCGEQKRRLAEHTVNQSLVERTEVEQPTVDRVTDQLPAVDRDEGQLPAIDRVTDQLPAVDRNEGQPPASDRVTDQLPAVDRDEGQLAAIDRVTDQLPAVDRNEGQLPASDRVTDQLPAVDRNEGQLPATDRVEDKLSADVDRVTDQLPAVDRNEGQLPAIDRVEDKLSAVNRNEGQLPASDIVTDQLPAVDRDEGQLAAIDRVTDQLPAVDRNKGQLPASDRVTDQLPAVDRNEGQLPAIDRVEDKLSTDVDRVTDQLPAVDRNEGQLPTIDRVEDKLSTDVDRVTDQLPAVDRNENHLQAIDRVEDKLSTDVDGVTDQLPAVDRNEGRLPAIDKVENKLLAVNRNEDHLLAVERVEDKLSADVDRVTDQVPAVDRNEDKLSADVDRVTDRLPAVDRNEGQLPAIDRVEDKLSAVDRNEGQLPATERVEDKLSNDVDRVTDQLLAVDRNEDHLQAIDRVENKLSAVNRNEDHLLAVERVEDKLSADVDRVTDQVPAVDRNENKLSTDVDRGTDQLPAVDRNEGQLPAIDRVEDKLSAVNRNEDHLLAVERVEDKLSTDVDRVTGQLPAIDAVENKLSAVNRNEDHLLAVERVEDKLSTGVDRVTDQLPAVDRNEGQLSAIDIVTEQLPAVYRNEGQLPAIDRVEDKLSAVNRNEYHLPVVERVEDKLTTDVDRVKDQLSGYVIRVEDQLPDAVEIVEGQLPATERVKGCVHDDYEDPSQENTCTLRVGRKAGVLVVEEYVSDSDSSDVIPIQNMIPLQGVLKAEADSTSSEAKKIDEESYTNNIQIQEVQTSGKRKFDKKQACYFCENNYVLKMARHLQGEHSDVPEIGSLPKFDRNNKATKVKRNTVFAKYRNLGNFNNNIKVLREKSGIFFVGRRPQKGHKLSVSEFVPCQYCLTFFMRGSLWRHVKHCNYRHSKIDFEVPEKLKRDLSVKAGESLLQGALGSAIFNSSEECQQFRELVLNRLHRDNVSLSIKSDELLLQFGKAEFSRLGSLRAGQVREKLRVLGRLKLILRTISGKESASLGDFITVDMFDTCVAAIKQLGCVSDEPSLSGTKTYGKPSIALKAGEFLKKVAGMKRGQAVRNRDVAKKDEISEFIELYDTEFKAVSSVARQTINERKFNRKVLLPLTEDLLKYVEYLENRMTSMTSCMLTSPSRGNWHSLAQVTLARVLFFNKRRSNEAARMLVDQYQIRPKWFDENSELVKALQPIEKNMLKQMDLVEVLGKQNKRVPVLLTKSMVAALDAMITYRKEAEVKSCNPYVFAEGHFNHMKGCTCVRKTATVAQLQHPERVTSTKLRKYLATVSQLFNLKQTELEELARHMGHELSVHRNFYRLQDDVIELAKVSRLLIAVEEGKAHKFTGCNLDDINVEDIEVEEDKHFELEEDKHTELEDDESDSDRNDIEIEEDELAKDGEIDSKVTPENYGDDLLSDTVVEVDKCKVSSEPTRVNEDRRVRTKWSDCEKKEIKEHLLPIVKKYGKPPTRHEILLVQSNSQALKERTWKSIKFTAWAMYQKETKKTNTVISSLLNRS